MGCAIYCVQDLPDDVPLYPVSDHSGQPSYVPPIFQQDTQPTHQMTDTSINNTETVDLLGTEHNGDSRNAASGETPAPVVAVELDELD